MNFALSILKKQKTTIEMNLKGTDAIKVDAETMRAWRKQLRDLKSTIEFLELREKRKKA